MKVVMGDTPHLEVQMKGHVAGDLRQVLIDQRTNDIRICDGNHVIKIQFGQHVAPRKILHVLVDDIIIPWP